MRTLMLATVTLSALASGSAQAVPFAGTFGVTVYQTENGGSTSGSPRGQAAFPATVPSSPTFARTSLVNVTGSSSGTPTGNVIHDDGTSPFSGPGSTPRAASRAPTTVISTPYTLPGSDSQFRPIHVAADGAPAVLTRDATSSAPAPEPTSLALPGVGLMSRRAV